MSPSGFAELRTALDLLIKLRHDMQRMQSLPEDQYAAFDFFITAEHIVDWLHPRDKDARRMLRAANPLLRVTSHLASGAKHFHVQDARHRSVIATEKVRYVERDYVEEGYFADPLIISLTAEEAAALDCERTIEAVKLGRRILEFWEDKFKP